MRERDNETIRARERVCLCEGSISTIMNELLQIVSSARGARGVIQRGKSGEFLFYRNQHSTSLNLPGFFRGEGGRSHSHCVTMYNKFSSLTAFGG